MKTEVLKIIQDIQEGKEKKHIFPTHALQSEILYVARKRIEKAISQLATEGQIKQGNTINEPFVSLNTQTNERKSN
ncbi:hypothetical protein LX69_01127 [Breznakibacter xylanolyticus]|uniref:Uncharacterized protein n=1 Tax=Breznakibacter xylanolyticus TaxID=990 RepID=A0A2W7NDS6_9BACT|nr:hypothetical protein [Breznakibacter xylanolyticus]PZX18090.1 hypothetical protein LX69_01127 [Breznakibacter xylanolyticus]